MVPFFTAAVEDNTLTRDEMISIAEAYTIYTWISTEENSIHGTDPKGVNVDTPDRDSFADWPPWKGWSPGENTGVPYKWGGFSCIPESEYRGKADRNYRFDEGIKEGKYAGDINCDKNRNSSEKYTVGVDCSGFVSRCWKLSHKYSTRDLPDISQPILFEDLTKGDILNCYNAHVLLVKEFVTVERTIPGKTRIRIYHASGIDWKVSEWEYLLKTIEKREEKFRGVLYETSGVTLEVVGRVTPDGIESIAAGYNDNHTYVPRTYFTERPLPFIRTPQGMVIISCVIVAIILTIVMLKKEIITF